MDSNGETIQTEPFEIFSKQQTIPSQTCRARGAMGVYPPPPQWTMNVQVLDNKVSYHKKKNIYIYIYIHKWPSKCTAYSLKTTQYFKFLKGGRPPTPLESSMIFFVIQFYYIDAYEILGFFISLKNHIFIARSKDTIFIFHV